MRHSTPSVLIVDASAENREVLRTVLERRGLRIFEADEAERGLELAREHQPDVIVADLEGSTSSHSNGQPPDWESQYGSATGSKAWSLVLLGRARLAARAGQPQVIAKPFHFGPLVRTIEQLAAKAA